MSIAQEAIGSLGVLDTCRALGISRATFYRQQRAQNRLSINRRRAPRRLSSEEESQVLQELTSLRFIDQAVPEIYATLLDEGLYWCSLRTMYRILARHQAVRERRHQVTHPVYQKPELMATGPNQVWSWDITKLRGPAGMHYSLYVVLDIFSRCVVGWIVAEREFGALAECLISETCAKQGIPRDQLILHADRGNAMRSKPVAQLLADLGVTRTHSRPHVSNDNPFSEAQFKTLKYHPTFPERFESLEEAKVFLREFFRWYNHDHRHSGIALMTPDSVHTGEANERWNQRCQVMQQAFQKHPERFVHGEPMPPKPPSEVWINKPIEKAS